MCDKSDKSLKKEIEFRVYPFMCCQMIIDKNGKSIVPDPAYCAGMPKKQDVKE